MNDIAERNFHWAYALIDGIAATGVTRAVISPGSRSTPLILACEKHPDIKIWTHIDERSAGFFALGMARGSQKPVMVIATSGSAPSHWYPAIIEANRSETPLLCLSADRPPELHQCGANQTVDQSGIFSHHVRGYFNPGTATDNEESMAYIHRLGTQAAERSRWPQAGPVHINIPFREPLVPKSITTLIPKTRPAIRTASPAPVNTDHETIQEIAEKLSGKPGYIVCGPNNYDAPFAEKITVLAKKLACPIMADPLSGLRFGPHDASHIQCHYDATFRSTSFITKNTPEWIIRFGAAPVSATLLKTLSTTDCLQISVTLTPDWPDPHHMTNMLVRSDPISFCQQLLAADMAPCPKHWIEGFSHAAPPAVHADDNRSFESNIIAELIDQLSDNSLIFSGNSMPIRQFDSWSGQTSKPLRLVANRGASGIDGNISTLLGLASSSNHPVVGLIGDLTFFHDLNGLMAAHDINAVIIVLNNGGGGIFGYLPQAELPSFEQHWTTPVNLELMHAAKLFKLNFQRISKQSEFTPALARALKEEGVSLLEVMIDRDYSMARHQAYWANFTD